MSDPAQLPQTLAADLKAAGLTWTPRVHDFFTIPDTAFGDRAFVIADIMASIEVLKGHPAITFNGVVEWALDYVFQQDALWLPTETQLRDQLEMHLTGAIVLRSIDNQYMCEITIADVPLTFTGRTASEAYGRALLSRLRTTFE